METAVPDLPQGAWGSLPGPARQGPSHNKLFTSHFCLTSYDVINYNDITSETISCIRRECSFY